jgi:CheY-like chemotaxis protein
MNNQHGARGTIFLVEEDDDVRPNLRRNLQKHGYRMLLAMDEEDALDRAGSGGGGVPADLVLIDLVDKPVDEVLQAGRRIREHAKIDGRTPLVVLAEKYGADLEGTDVNVSGNDWITYLADHEQLKNLLARLLGKSSKENAA